MLAVHGFWRRGRGLCLWAEDSDRSVKSSSQATRSARQHPFTATANELAQIHPGKPEEATLLLPSLRRAPLDSPELVRVSPRPETTTKPMLLPWSVPVVRFDPPTALATLDDTVEEVRYGASVTFLRELAAFARELAERGRVLPTLEAAESPDEQSLASHAARWRPVLQGPDIVALQELVGGMPPACRAEADTPTDTRGQNPTDLVSGALHALADAAAREQFMGRSLLDQLPRRRGRRPKRAPVAEAWLQALTATDPHFDAQPDDAGKLEQSLAPWVEFGTGQTGPARATFRLTDARDTPSAYDGMSGDGQDEGDQEEADQDWDGQDEVGQDEVGQGEAAAVSEDRPWRLEFLLQSVEDPSLLVPADQVWTGAEGLRRWLDRPDELLLAELGRASAVMPELSDALRQPRPSVLELDAEGAYDFLSSKAAPLDQAGFGVLVPSWWSNRSKLGLTGSAYTPQDGVVTGGRFSRAALVQFEWQLAIGDDPLTEGELSALAATKTPLVRLRGQWVAVDPEQVRRGLEFLRRQSDEPKTSAEIIALAASHPDDLDTPLPVTSVRANGWLGELLDGSAERALRPVPTPTGFEASLRPYQERGLSWLAFLSELGLGACLADDMGLGKTIQLLALETHRREADPDTGPTLLLCPMSLVGNWQREAARFAPALRLYAHHGAGRCRGADLEGRLASTDIVVTTYQTATRDIDELASQDWDRVVLDEAQAVKNSLSQAAKAVRRLSAPHRVALTGTPMENRLAELWSIMDFLNPGILGSSELFRARYAVPVERHGQTEPAERLRTITRPYILRRLKTDTEIIDDLPEKIEVKQYCHLTAEQASLYQSVVDDMLTKIESSEGIERRGNVLAAMTKLKQVCNHPAQLLHDHSPVRRRSGKVARLEEILDEILAEGDQVLCFTQFTEFAELLLPHLAARFDSDVAYLHGKTPKKRRDEMIRRFQEPGGPSIFLLSLKAGGTGLNLTAASHVIHLDRWWNPAVENQATDRAFRIGQHRNVQVSKFVCAGTLEEKIDDVIEEKKALTDMVIRDGEQWLTELSTHDLRDLFALSEGAVGE
ncbi:MAG: DEAD/DEAH box helicase [Nocardioidaceae bacterium]